MFFGWVLIIFVSGSCRVASGTENDILAKETEPLESILGYHGSNQSRQPILKTQSKHGQETRVNWWYLSRCTLLLGTTMPFKNTMLDEHLENNLRPVG